MSDMCVNLWFPKRRPSDPNAMLFYLWMLLKCGVCGDNPHTEDDLK
jgi:hypothetical protein